MKRQGFELAKFVIAMVYNVFFPMVLASNRDKSQIEGMYQYIL